VFDRVIRGGRVIDGTGDGERTADVGVVAGRIAAVESTLDDDDADVVDATGRVVTPGFVDIHAHYDGQATWDDLLEPSTSHGVTTVILGNCGVGFAPVAADGHDRLIALMEGVEDIPGATLREGIAWRWESFPEYLDALDGQNWSVDVATQLPHGPLRTYVMEDPVRAQASAAEIARMAFLTREAVEAGALGFTTSRTLGHRSLDGTPVPGTYAAEDELLALGHAVSEGGGRVFEVAGSGLARSDDPGVTHAELGWIGRLAGETGLSATFVLLQCHDAPERWRAEMAAAAAWRQQGACVIPLVAGRPAGVLWGWDVRHPFLARDAYRAVAHLPLPERLAVLRRPEVRRSILSEPDRYLDPGEQRQLRYIRLVLPDCFSLRDEPDYEQPGDQTLGALAERRGTSLDEVAYDELLRDGAMLIYPLYNYFDRDAQALYEQLLDPDAVVGLNDGGAHCAFICDASIPTYLLTHWVRDRTRGPRLSLTEAVRRLTSQPADLYGLEDRGRIRAGKRADLNIIDLDHLALLKPRAVSDLPAGGTRLLQDAVGYDATVVAGVVTRRSGRDTGARPGRLIRG
jgi:N-acyl-D-amino-acid deacylase